MNEIINSDIKAYSRCMGEVKQRLVKISQQPEKNILDGLYYLEFMCLQVRKICELFAFATLIANRILYEKVRTEFYKDWNFKRILDTVEKVNPKYFPEPLTPIAGQDGKTKDFEGKQNDYLLREHIEKIYTECSDFIHAKNHYEDLEKFYPQNNKEYLPWRHKLDDWQERFIKLLSCHVIGINREDFTRIYITFMYFNDLKKKVEVIQAGGMK